MYVPPSGGHLLGEYFTHAFVRRIFYACAVHFNFVVAVGELDLVTNFHFVVLCSGLSVLSGLSVC